MQLAAVTLVYRRLSNAAPADCAAATAQLASAAIYICSLHYGTIRVASAGEEILLALDAMVFLFLAFCETDVVSARLEMLSA